MTSVRVATVNARKELRGATVEQLARQVASIGADVILWQEVETAAHRAAIRGLKGYATFWPGGSGNALPISYKPSTFPVQLGQGKKVIVKGDSNPPGGGWPDRLLTWLVLKDHDGLVWPFVDAHLMHQAWTSHPERRRFWQLHAWALRQYARWFALRYGACVGGGDMNRSKWAPKGTVGLWATHPTYAGRFYDVIFVRGRVRVLGAAVRIHTVSDHDALAVRLERY